MYCHVLSAKQFGLNKQSFSFFMKTLKSNFIAFRPQITVCRFATGLSYGFLYCVFRAFGGVGWSLWSVIMLAFFVSHLDVKLSHCLFWQMTTLALMIFANCCRVLCEHGFDVLYKYVCMQLNAAAAAAFNWLDPLGRGTSGRPAATISATTATVAATVFSAIVRRLQRVWRRRPWTDVYCDGVSGRAARHVTHRWAGCSSVGDNSDVKCVGVGTDRKQSDIHGSRHIVCYVDERYARVAERTNKRLQGQTVVIIVIYMII